MMIFPLQPSLKHFMPRFETLQLAPIYTAGLLTVRRLSPEAAWRVLLTAFMHFAVCCVL